MKRLLHCPFCGEEEDVRLFTKTDGLNYPSYTSCISCDSCDMRGPKTTSSNKDVARDTAVNDWNNRLPHDQDLAKRIAFALE